MPSAATVAALEPEIAPNSSAALTVVSAMPPGTRPRNDEIQLISRVAMPPRPMTLPAKMKPGTDSRTRLLMVPVSPCTTTSMETPCQVMAAIAMTRKIIHMGMPRNRSAKAPIAMAVSTRVTALRARLVRSPCAAGGW